jgi:hypothetical protein
MTPLQELRQLREQLARMRDQLPAAERDKLVMLEVVRLRLMIDTIRSTVVAC